MALSKNISKCREAAKAEGGVDYAAKRADLLEAAALLFKRQGYQATTLADIARSVGLDRASIYYYTGSKEEPLRETLKEFWLRV